MGPIVLRVQPAAKALGIKGPTRLIQMLRTSSSTGTNLWHERQTRFDLDLLQQIYDQLGLPPGLLLGREDILDQLDAMQATPDEMVAAYQTFQQGAILDERQRQIITALLALVTPAPKTP